MPESGLVLKALFLIHGVVDELILVPSSLMAVASFLDDQTIGRCLISLGRGPSAAMPGRGRIQHPYTLGLAAGPNLLSAKHNMSLAKEQKQPGEDMSEEQQTQESREIMIEALEIHQILKQVHPDTEISPGLWGEGGYSVHMSVAHAVF